MPMALEAAVIHRHRRIGKQADTTSGNSQPFDHWFALVGEVARAYGARRVVQSGLRVATEQIMMLATR